MGPSHSPIVDPLPQVQRLVVEVGTAPPPLLVVTDFDGTLSAIVSDPNRARIEPAARAALRRLSRIGQDRPGRVLLAVLSGRPVVDVAARVRVGGVLYVGNHGLEWGRLKPGNSAEHLVVSAPYRGAALAPARRALGARVAARLGNPEWLVVEEKGPALAFHYRMAANPGQARRSMLEAISAAEREIGGSALDRLEGRRVIELRPRDAAGKGASVKQMLAGGLTIGPRPASAFILGDDRTDADAFRTVRAARDHGQLRKALIVCVSGGQETLPEVTEAADVLVSGPRQAARLLSTLATTLERETPIDERR